MNINFKFSMTLLLLAAMASSCVSKKKFVNLQKQFDLKQTELEAANKDLGACGKSLNDYMNQLALCKQGSTTGQKSLEEQLAFAKQQLADCQALRDKQLSQVDDLTRMSHSANDNIKETLAQLEGKDRYIKFLQNAKTRADSINLALSVNLMQVLRDGIEDKDVEVKVDKTVVFINLSDKMLYQSGSATLTPRAQEVLGKIAQIVASRPDVEVMVEGYTDNVPIKNACMDDNWDLSVKRSTAVVRVLQNKYKVDPNRLIAAGRGEYNTLAPNTTPEGRSTNRRTRIIIMPKLDQFYELLDPKNAPKK